MASVPQRVRGGTTLEEFLRRKDIEDKPYLEYIDGRIEAKAFPRSKHSMIQGRLIGVFGEHTRSGTDGDIFPKLRCTFEGRSIVPDLVFLREENIPVDETGELVNIVLIPPDIHIEILSPDQAARSAHEKLVHSTAHGTALGVFIDPERKTIDIYRPNRPPERLGDDGAIDGEPVLPGLRLSVAEVFGRLVRRRPG